MSTASTKRYNIKIKFMQWVPKWSKVTVFQKAVIEFALLCKEQQIKAAMLSMCHTGRFDLFIMTAGQVC